MGTYMHRSCAHVQVALLLHMADCHILIMALYVAFLFYMRVATAGGGRNINQWDTQCIHRQKDKLERHD